MARSFVPVVLTANDLIEGDAVWWTGCGWSRDVSEAAVFAAEPEAAAAEAALAASGLEVVGLYRVEVGPGPFPLLRREQIRAERRPTFAYAPAAALAEAA